MAENVPEFAAMGCWCLSNCLYPTELVCIIRVTLHIAGIIIYYFHAGMQATSTQSCIEAVTNAIILWLVKKYNYCQNNIIILAMHYNIVHH